MQIARAVWEIQSVRLDYKEEKRPAGVFQFFLPLRVAAQKRTDRGPLLTLHDQRRYPLDTSRFCS
ncbi:MAG: hypothetical protein IJV76_11515, partial [Clostridia bacterium]|nr:hypothetical protein [Clostridia bacterium]